MTLPHPVQQFFSIGEVCSLTDLKPHVLRYWESQFRFLSPAKNRSGNRVYKAREVELIMLVKHLLYTEKFTIDGARQRLDQYRKSGELKASAKDAMRYETVREVQMLLDDVLTVLNGKEPPVRLAVAVEVPAAVAIAPDPEPEPAPVRTTGPKLVRDKRPDDGGEEQLSLA
ncbi:MAG: MerR family transcriptional regulator [Gemmatimonadota bacterium]